jgi:glycosyltransferase involved in cell wall biosynthesis
VDAVLHLDELLRRAGLRDRVAMFWNANNIFGFNRIDWRSLDRAAVITTVSRYMRYRMWALGVDPLVVPNGLSADALDPPEKEAVSQFRNRLKGRTVLGKVARWDPDKRWLLALATVVELKRRGERPLLIARGGVESHCHEVLQEAADAGLTVAERNGTRGGANDLLRSLEGLENVDVVNLRSHLDPPARRVLFRGADAILANSGHEPFGLVGLETMAAGGLACTGGTGEDYAVPGWNALVLQSTDPREFVTLFKRLKANPSRMRALRRHGVSTAKQYAWEAILERALLPRVARAPMNEPEWRRCSADQR